MTIESLTHGAFFALSLLGVFGVVGIIAISAKEPSRDRFHAMRQAEERTTGLLGSLLTLAIVLGIAAIVCVPFLI